jgi:F-type H+-transporting ATPase subunit delta
MREQSISKNYAEALLALAKKADATEEWGGLVHALAGAIESDITLRRFLSAPQVSAAQKSELIGKGLQGKAPAHFIKFVQKVIANRRQLLIAQIASAYTDLLDSAAGRVHARVTVAKAVSDAEMTAITAQLSTALKKIVVPHVTVNPKILGGIVVRVGDTVMDGSVQRRLGAVRAKMLGTR